MENEHEWLKPSEVAEMFRVDTKTVNRWTKSGKFGPEGIEWMRTPGGHLRFRASAVRRRTEARREVPA